MDNSSLFRLLEIGESFSGFRLESRHATDELQCDLWVLEHSPTGAKLAYFDSGDDERCFTLSFRAIPTDDTGVFHILEHCFFLHGSLKYPVRNLSELGPIHTFASAFTSRTNTMYPVASKHEAAFQDLVRIYADCVFSPGFLRSPFPLMQEGWHYDYDERTDTLRINGIVYSEMKAVYDMPEFILEDAQLTAAFPNTLYARRIGGSPEHIPTLTYEHFLDTYHRFFRPENCLVAVWGNANLASIIEVIAPYLERYPVQGNAPRIIAEPAIWNGAPLRVEYPAGARGNQKDTVSLGWVLDEHRQTAVTAQVVVRLLRGPLSDLLAKRGTSGQISLSLIDEPRHPLLTLTVRGTDSSEIDSLRREVATGLKEITLSGLSQTEIDAAITASEFAFREGPGLVPRGIQAFIDVTNAWVHALPLTSRLTYNDCLVAIRQGEWAHIADFIHRSLIENKNYSEVVLSPSTMLTECRQEAERQRLRDIRARMDQKSLRSIAESARDLRKHLDTPEDPGVLAALPKTSVSDLESTPPLKDIAERDTRRGTVLYLDVPGDVIDMTLYFPITRFGNDHLNLLGVLGLLFGHLGQAEHSAADTAVRTGICTGGGITATPVYYTRAGNDYLFMEVTLSTLPDRFGEAQRLLLELLDKTDFTEKATVRAALLRYLNKHASAAPDPASRVKAYFSHGGAAAQLFGGLGQEHFVQSLVNDFEARFPTLCEQLSEAALQVFRKDHVTVGVACGKHIWPKVRDGLVIDSAPQAGSLCTVPLLQPDELFPHAGTMQYTAMGGRLKHRTGPLLAACEAGQRLLHREVREIGGAYTVRMSLSPENDLVMLSGRDPNLRSTMEAFRRIHERVASADDRQLLSTAVGAASAFGSSGKAQIGGFSRRRPYNDAIRRYWDGLAGPEGQRLWEELLGSSPDDIRKAATLMAPATERGYFCSWASKQKIADEGAFVRPTGRP
jgi:Zn-dependent M16 (insulinase) family peptidase